MKNYTVKDVKAMCDELIKEGKGDLKVLISQDDEGNGYHGLYYGFSEMNDDFVNLCEFPVNKNNIKEYIILG